VSLRFRVADLQNELINLETLARPRLPRTQHGRLRQLADELLRFSQRPGTTTWGWPEDDPLVLAASAGAYQPGRGGRERIVAKIDARWELRRVDKGTVEVAGLASVRVWFNEGALGMWRMELGDESAPGCFFHVQILGQDEGRPWPKSVDVPRLPGLVATPASVVEFVLGELFQDDWPKEVARSRNAARQWQGVQRRWWTAMLGWQREIAAEAEGSPWAAIKAAKPDRDLLLAR